MKKSLLLLLASAAILGLGGVYLLKYHKTNANNVESGIVAQNAPKADEEKVPEQRPESGEKSPPELSAEARLDLQAGQSQKPLLVVSQASVQRFVMAMLEKKIGQPISPEIIKEIPKELMMPIIKKAQSKALEEALALEKWKDVPATKKRALEEAMRKELAVMNLRSVLGEAINKALKEKEEALMQQIAKENMCSVQTVIIAGKNSQSEVQSLRQNCRTMASDGRSVTAYLKTYADTANPNYGYVQKEIPLSRLEAFFKEQNIEEDKAKAVMQKIKEKRAVGTLLVGNMDVSSNEPVFALIHLTSVVPASSLKPEEQGKIVKNIIKTEIMPKEYQNQIKNEISKYKVSVR